MNKIFNLAMFLFFFASLTLAVEPDKTVETGKTIQLSASASDKDCHFKSGECPHLDPDNAFTYSWSATAGSFPSGNTGQSVTWKAPDSPCDVTVNVTATNSDNTKAVESASKSIWVKVIPEVILDLISPSEGAKLVFNENTPGVLAIGCEAVLISGTIENLNDISFDCDSIGSSTKFVGPVQINPSNGHYICTITFTNLPFGFADFGKKDVKVKYKGTEKDTSKIKVFFLAKAKNWPGAAPEPHPKPEISTNVNWIFTRTNDYYYYSQTSATVPGLKYHYQGSECSPDDHQYGFRYFVGCIDPYIEIWDYKNPISTDYIANSGDKLYGINVFAWAARHEYKHHQDYISWWSVFGVIPCQDIDGDNVKDNFEPFISAANGGPYSNFNPRTHGSFPTAPNNLDDQVECLFSQMEWTVGILDDQDWGSASVNY